MPLSRQVPDKEVSLIHLCFQGILDCFIHASFVSLT